MKISRKIWTIAAFAVILSVLLISVSNSIAMNVFYRNNAVVAVNGKLPLLIGNTARFWISGAAKFVITGGFALIIGKMLHQKSDKKE